MPEKHTVSQNEKTYISQKTIFLAIFILLLVGSFFRLYKLSTQSYWMDEGYTINAILSINEKGSSILDSSEYYSCPTYCYPTVFITKFFGENTSSFRILSAIAGIIFIVVIFYVVLKLFSKDIALLSSFFVTFSYWQIAWSRQARWYTLFSLFFWLSIFFFYKTLYGEKNKIIYLLFSATFTILAIITHGLGYLLPFIFFGWFLIDQIFIKKKFDWKIFLSATITTLLTILIIDKFLKLNFAQTLLTDLHIYYTLPYYLNFYLRKYWFFITLSIIAFYTSDIYKKEIRFLYFIVFSYLTPLSFLTDIVHYRYLFHITPIFYILASITILNIYKQIPRQNLKYIFIFIITIIFFTTGGGILIPKDFYYLESDNLKIIVRRPHYAYTPQPDWNSAYNFIKESKKDTDIIISSQPQFNKIFLKEAGYWIKYDYLGTKERKILF